ncbi:MAG: hypothetical protein Hens3KO_20760 [Henriciella sp.]
MSRIEELWAREKIRDRLIVYCQAIDQRDWPLLRSCFGDDHQHDHGSFQGDADAFIAFAKQHLTRAEFCRHILTNIHIVLEADGLHAQTQSSFFSIQRFPGEGETPSTDWLVSGSYHDTLVCDQEDWLIVKRVGKNEWIRKETVQPSS